MHAQQSQTRSFVAKFLVEAKSHGSKREQAVLDMDQIVHLFGATVVSPTVLVQSEISQ
jgi:hypothetical protein